MSSEIWLPGDRFPYKEVDLREGGGCDLCPGLRKVRGHYDEDGTLVPRYVCNVCDKTIPNYPRMGDAGYQSYSVHHVHLTDMGVTHPGRRVINVRLCKECMADDYRMAYPNNPLPRELESEELQRTISP